MVKQGRCVDIAIRRIAKDADTGDVQQKPWCDSRHQALRTRANRPEERRVGKEGMSHAHSAHPGERRREGKMRRCAEEGNDEARAVHEASKNEDTPMSPDGSGTRRSKEVERSRGGVSDLAGSGSTFAKTMAKKKR